MINGFGRFLRRNTIALLALFLALGGTTWAASSALIGKNTVASPQVVNGSLQTKDLSAKARKALKGNRGLRGLRGLQGAKGATGAQGVKGDKGDLGPTAARFVNSATSVNITGVNQAVVDLASINAQGNQQITTTVPSTIMATAMIRMVTNTAVAARSNCQLFISDGTGPTNGLTLMQQGFVTANDTPATASFFQTHTYIGAATKPAGTYNVQVQCSEVSGDLSTSQLHQLQVWAVGS
jgi:hypothetical protein